MMSNYDVFVNELYKIDLSWTVYSVHDDEILYDYKHPQANNHNLVWFYTLDKHFPPNCRYISRLSELQRQAVSEIRLLSPDQQNRVLYDTLEHKVVLNEVLDDAKKCKKIWESNRLPDLESGLIDFQILNRPCLFVSQWPEGDVFPKPHIQFGNQLVRLFEWKIDSLIELINKVEKGLNSAQSGGLGKTKEPKQTLEEFFKRTSKYKIVMEMLVEEGFCESGTYIWTDTGSGHKSMIVGLIKYLHSQGFYLNNVMPSTEEVVLIAENIFGVEISQATVKGTKVASSTKSNFSFIRPADTYE